MISIIFYQIYKSNYKSLIKYFKAYFTFFISKLFIAVVILKYIKTCIEKENFKFKKLHMIYAMNL